MPTKQHVSSDSIAAFLQDRIQFPLLLNALSLTGEGVEVGVQCGVFSEIILREWHGRTLHCVDPWREFPQDKYVDVSNVDQRAHDDNYEHTQVRLRQFSERVHILRKSSREAAAKFVDGQLDFVYLDAQHHYQAVREDIDLWVPKVRRGGILAGHDYLNGEGAAGVFGVKSAVDEFVAERRLRLYVTQEDYWPTWYVLIGD